VAAQFALAVCYARGRGVYADMAEAARWSRKAATQLAQLPASESPSESPRTPATAEAVPLVASSLVPTNDVAPAHLEGKDSPSQEASAPAATEIRPGSLIPVPRARRAEQIPAVDPSIEDVPAFSKPTSDDP